jgi:hypothetical protein
MNVISVKSIELQYSNQKVETKMNSVTRTEVPWLCLSHFCTHIHLHTHNRQFMHANVSAAFRGCRSCLGCIGKLNFDYEDERFSL